jgi:error-prone DNA polymerase
METEERIVADYRGTGLTTGPHPMFYKRAVNIKSAVELRATANGTKATVAGSVITRQRPGTAKGLIFLNA